MPWGVAAAAAIGVAGSALSADAAGSAADKSAETQLEAQRRSQELSQPFIDTGRNALNVVGNLSGANGVDAAKTAGQDFFTSPGYDFRMSEGSKAIENSASVRGLAGSGATAKALTEYGQGLASQEFSNYYNRLSNLATGGQNAAAGVGTGINSTAAGIAQTEASAGGALASIYGNTASSLGGMANTYANNGVYQQKTNALMGGAPEVAAPQVGGSGWGAVGASGYAGT